MSSMKIAEIISFAVKQEELSSALYLQAMEQAPDDKSRKLLSELAGEELEHSHLFAMIQEDGSGLPVFSTLPETMVSEFLVDIPLHEGMTFAEVMIYAIKKEEKSSRFYRELASKAADPQLASLLNKLADIEQTHKARLEEAFIVEVSDAI